MSLLALIRKMLRKLTDVLNTFHTYMKPIKDMMIIKLDMYEKTYFDPRRKKKETERRGL